MVRLNRRESFLAVFIIEDTQFCWLKNIEYTHILKIDMLALFFSVFTFD